VVPGGCTPARIPDGYRSLIDWVRAAHEHTTYTTSVCTGSLLLGAAGLLDGLEATSHWRSLRRLPGYGARPTGQRVVFQDKVVTGAGISAGIDLALAVVARLSGPETAQAIQLLMEYDPQPPFDTGAPDKASPAIHAAAEDLSARTDGARREAIWPNGRRYDTDTAIANQGEPS
jgi:transcriptional regulator GlxA family with amidase domain